MSEVPGLNVVKLPLIRTVQRLEIPNHDKGILRWQIEVDPFIYQLTIKNRLIQQSSFLL